MIREILTYWTVLSMLFVLSPVQGAEPASTNQVPEHMAAPIAVGDSLQHVLDLLGDPRVDCPLQDGKRILIYEEGEIHLQHGTVISCFMLTEQELVEKREREKRKIERAAAAAKRRKPTDSSSDVNSLHQEALRIGQAISNVRRDLLYSQKMAERHMSSSIEAFSLMNRKGGASPRHDRNLADQLPNNSMDEFYRINFNFAFFERKYARIPPAILTLKTLEREHALFIQEYERMLELGNELKVLEKQLQQVEHSAAMMQYRSSL